MFYIKTAPILFLFFMMSLTACKSGHEAKSSTPSNNDPNQPDDRPTPTPNLNSPRSSAKVYWVGHSLISAQDSNAPGTLRLTDLLTPLVQAVGQNYSFYRHTTPGAPIGWNWGNPDAAWNGGISTRILPLVDPNHQDYGTFDTIVVTEGVAVESSYQWWASGFYLRKFLCAAKNANPDAELFFYESWGHYQKTDSNFDPYYGSVSPWNFITYQEQSYPTWQAIMDEASDPSQTPSISDYTTWRLGPNDPGDCSDVLDIKAIPTGKVLVALMRRLAENRPSDDWSYAGASIGSNMTAGDLFANAYIDYPTNTTTAHGGTVDDIHPSHLLIYLNSLVHYATIYRRNPATLPTANDVPENIANIMKEVAWTVVINDPRTGVAAE